MSKSPGQESLRESPLGEWLRRMGKSQAAFSKEWHAATGLRLAPQVISRWARGDATPIPHHRLIIARITLGAVPVDAWGKA